MCVVDVVGSEGGKGGRGGRGEGSFSGNTNPNQRTNERNQIACCY